MQKVYIIHGYGGYPEKNWFPWLKDELEKIGVEAKVFKMPNSESPKYLEWLEFLQHNIGKPDKNTFLVGHSLGCAAILQYLNNLESEIKIGGTVLVAGFASPIHYHELDEFFEKPFDYEKIKKSVSKIIAINSDNDPHITWQQSEDLQNKFGAELIKIHDGGHLNEKSGFKTFTFLLDKIKILLNK